MKFNVTDKQQAFPTTQEILDYMFDEVFPQYKIHPDLGEWEEFKIYSWSPYWDVWVTQTPEFNMLIVIPVVMGGNDMNRGITIYRVKR